MFDRLPVSAGGIWAGSALLMGVGHELPRSGGVWVHVGVSDCATTVVPDLLGSPHHGRRHLLRTLGATLTAEHPRHAFSCLADRLTQRADDLPTGTAPAAVAAPPGVPNEF